MSKQNTILLALATLSICEVILALSIRHNTSPTVTIWSWDYPDDLRFIKAEDHINVAYYAGTIYMRQGRCYFRPRTKPLKINAKVNKYPAIRIESDGVPASTKAVAALIRTVLKEQGAKEVQLDFDATDSELSFYQDLLATLPSALEAGTTINITALTSWYTIDKTLTNLKANQKTAMCFSLGGSARESLKALAKLKQKPDSIGVSVYEHQTNKYLKSLGILEQASSIYLYSAVPWQQQTLQAARAEVLCR